MHIKLQKRILWDHWGVTLENSPMPRKPKQEKHKGVFER
jgi:hypothetical protein